VTEQIDARLALRHASKRKSGTWGPDDYDVIHDGRDIGRRAVKNISRRL
jgi:hypothetical protein